MKIFNRRDDAPIDKRVEDLAEVLTLAGDDLENRESYEDVLEVAADRLALNPDVTVVALLGATGSGKSSLFNALFEVEIAPVGVMRPTTTKALAATAPGDGANEILDWLGVKDRVYVPAGVGISPDVAVIDMPDIDSINQANLECAKRVARRADVLVWVVDPQKYADNALHSDFIKAYSHHSRVTLVTLTQTDLLSETDRALIIEDLSRLLERDGLRVPIVATSSVTGEGIAKLRMRINDTAALQRSESARLKADVEGVAESIKAELGASGKQLPSFTEADVVPKLTQASTRAAGAEAVASAVKRAYLHRSGKAVAWLPMRSLRSLRADPLKRWHLGEGEGEPHSMQLDPAAQSGLQVGLRSLTEEVSAGRPQVWANSMRSVAAEAGAEVGGDLADAVASTKLDIEDRRLGWWRFSNALQWLGWIAAIAGVLWLAAAWLAREFLLITWELPKYGQIPYPTWLLIAGVAWTLIVALISLAISRIAARRHARRSLQLVENSVKAVVREELWEPLYAEDQRQRRIIDLLSRL